MNNELNGVVNQVRELELNLERLHVYEEEAEATKAELAELRKGERSLNAALRGPKCTKRAW